jgi:hypothetical protein
MAVAHSRGVQRARRRSRRACEAAGEHATSLHRLLRLVIIDRRPAPAASACSVEAKWRAYCNGVWSRSAARLKALASTVLEFLLGGASLSVAGNVKLGAVGSAACNGAVRAACIICFTYTSASLRFDVCITAAVICSITVTFMHSIVMLPDYFFFGFSATPLARLVANGPMAVFISGNVAVIIYSSAVFRATSCVCPISAASARGIKLVVSDSIFGFGVRLRIVRRRTPAR